jgi:phage baseplate assembly protein W
MIPQNGRSDNKSEAQGQEPTRTYKIDPVSKRIIGMVDGLDALKQSVLKILSTERNEHEIYTSDYGFETPNIIGMDLGTISSVLRQRIQEALLRDDRIISVRDFQITAVDNEAITVEFTIESQYGNFTFSKTI